MEQFKIKQDEVFNTKVVLNTRELSGKTGKNQREIKDFILTNNLKYGQHKEGYGVELWARE